MNIVFLAPFGIRPKGTLIARMLPLAEELQKLGHAVTIVAPPYTNPEDSGKTEIVNGVRLVNVELPAGGKIAGTLPLAWRMFRTALAQKPDLVHLFKPKGYGGLAAMLLIALDVAGVRMPPLFLDTDDWEGKGGMNELQPYSRAEKWLFAFQERWLSRHCAGVSVASRELERLTERLGVPPERILYLPNCVHDRPHGNGATVRAKLGIDPQVPVLLLYTRFFEFGQERLHRILAEINRALPDVRVLVVGKGRRGEEAELVAAGRSLGFGERLILAGWVEPAELPDYLAAADAAVYPLDDTLVNRAKCPAKLTEIICAGIPVVSDRVGQATEYLDAPYLVSPSDTAEMADRIVPLLSDRVQGRQAGEEMRDRLLERFRWSGYAARLEQFYHLRRR